MNVGIIGAGFFGGLHAKAIQQLPQLHLTAAARTNPAELKEFTSIYGGKGYTDYEELISDRRVDIVVIATPHHLHTDAAVKAAKAGKHILVEKPLALSLEDCDAIRCAVNEAGVNLTVGFENRFAPAYRKAKEMVDSGELGTIVSGVSTMSKYWMEPNRKPWHLDRSTGGGMWLTAGIHCLDRMTWLFGSPIKSVSAQFATSYHTQKADDAGMVFVRYRDGKFGTVVSIGYSEGAPKHTTEIYLTKGCLAVDYWSVSVGSNDVWKEVASYRDRDWMMDALVEQWSSFLKHIKSKKPGPITGDYARHIMEAAFAAETSSSVGYDIVLPALEELE